MLVDGGRCAKYVRAPQDLLNTFVARIGFTYMYHVIAGVAGSS